jgi:Fic family protein
MLTPAIEPAAVEAKLDLLIALLRIAHSEPLKAERESILADPVSKSVLAATAETISAGELKKKVITQAKVSDMTAKRRITELVERGLLKRSGSGSHISYRNTGLIEI